jgi:hypothetical protein
VGSWIRDGRRPSRADTGRCFYAAGCLGLILTIRLRSLSVLPPQIPSTMRHLSAYARQSDDTSQPLHASRRWRLGQAMGRHLAELSTPVIRHYRALDHVACGGWTT